MGERPAYELRLSDFNPVPNLKPLSNLNNYGKRCSEESTCETYEDFARDYWSFIGRAALLAIYDGVLLGTAGIVAFKGLETFFS